LRILFIVLFLIGCGYKPTSMYTKPILGDKISTKVDIDIKNPVDSIFLKDALNEAVIGVFNSKIVKNGDSKIELKVGSVSISPIGYDKNGYPIFYRANSSIVAYIKDINGNLKTYSATGSYDFSINSNATLSDSIKHNAIKEAFIRALQMIEFKIAQVGIEGETDDNKSN